MKRYLILILAIIFSGSTFSQERFRSGIFLHHSTGDRIWGPNGSSTSVPDEIVKYNSSFGYSGDEICSLNESGWPVNPWDNEWERWHRIFDNEDPEADILPFLLSNKIIVIKSCFPSSSMLGLGTPSDTLTPTMKSIYNYKWHWRNFIKVMEKHPEVFFVVWTNAPLVAGATNDNAAFYSHEFCTWAKDTLAKDLDPLFGGFPENVYVFDFFHKLVGTDYKLKPEYAVSSTNSHPNAAATELIAPQFVEEVFDASIAYESIYNGTLQPPALSSPVDNATGVALNGSLTWGSVSGATSYKVEVSTQSDFSTTVVSTTETTTTFTFSGELTNNTTYYWRVRSVNGVGESSWSDVWIFTTLVSTEIRDTGIPQFLVYPNPTKGLINIDLESDFYGDVLIWIYFSNGQLVRTYAFKDNNESVISLNLESLKDGVYFVRVKTGGGERMEKIILNKD